MLGWGTNEPTNPRPGLRPRPTQLADERRQVPGPPGAPSPCQAARLAAILHNAAMDLWDVATEEDAAQMWEEARAIASRILAACPTA
jgi:hypothetical protein